MDRRTQTLRAELEKTDLLHEMRRLVVAVSGGPDSVCLLQLLHEWAGDVDEPPELLVGHVHHGIRGVEADRDAEFVESLAKERGLDFLCERGDAPALSTAEGTSLEAAARRLRYRVFRDWARDHKLDGIALGHHFDDQAETVLLRAIRGSGLKGLGGIPPRRVLLDEADPARRQSGRSVAIIRPLLGVRRADILDFLTERGLEAREDSSNADTTIPRNRVRSEILPALEEIQAGATVSLVRLSDFARRAHADLSELGDRAYREARTGAGAGWVSFDATSLASWPVSVLHEVIATARRNVETSAAVGCGEQVVDARSSGESGGALALRPFEALVREMTVWLRGGKQGGKVIHLGSRVEVELRYGKVSVRVRRANAGSEPGAESVLFRLPAREVATAARWEGWEFSVNWYDLPSDRTAPAVHGESGTRRPGEDETWAERFDLDVLESTGPLHVRGRRDGDVFHPLGAPGRKKLKEFFRECEIGPHRRHRIPLFASGETIQWVVGCRIGHLARCRPETRRVLEVRASRKG